ncbi:hypothetical protein ACH5RR_015788 [Cinchona calisaya]|uniref:Uncharacterized protein n=1 Tax=Cinchona calisaya TaxID=153742 RepID=A0ABD2ZU53_9GENT
MYRILTEVGKEYISDMVVHQFADGCQPAAGSGTISEPVSQLVAAFGTISKPVFEPIAAFVAYSKPAMTSTGCRISYQSISAGSADAGTPVPELATSSAIYGEFPSSHPTQLRL